MRKLTNVIYTHTDMLDEEQKDELIIPDEYNGLVAIESWAVNNELRRKAICVPSISDYIIGLGEFKEVKQDGEE